jgi:hypothetical protein
LLKSAFAIYLKVNIPKVVIRMTVVSFATSAPEVIVSVNNALNGSSDLALANVTKFKYCKYLTDFRNHITFWPNGSPEKFL